MGYDEPAGLTATGSKIYAEVRGKRA